MLGHWYRRIWSNHGAMLWSVHRLEGCFSVLGQWYRRLMVIIRKKCTMPWMNIDEMNDNRIDAMDDKVYHHHHRHHQHHHHHHHQHQHQHHRKTVPDYPPVKAAYRDSKNPRAGGKQMRLEKQATCREHGQWAKVLRRDDSRWLGK